jgi:hypothetical protein
MSMRTIARSSSKRKSASDLASSVLPTPVGPEEQERAGRPVGIGQSGPGAAHGVRDGPHGIGLADQPGADELLHVQQLLGLALQQPAGGDAGPGRDDLGDVVGADPVLDHDVAPVPVCRCASAGLRLGLGGFDEFLLQRGDLAVEQACGALVVGFPLERSAWVRRSSRRALSSPTRFRPDFSASQRAFSPASSSALSARSARSRSRRSRRVVGLLGQVHLLHPQPVHGALQLSISTGRGVDLHPQPRGGLVDQVDGLVGQLAPGDVAVRESGRGDQRGVLDLDLVVGLVALLEPAQDRDGVLDARLADEDLLEAPLQRGSFSMCSRYSSRVVAPTIRSSPRASRA